MIDHRRLLKTLATLGTAAALLAACKHWPEGQYPRRSEPPESRDGGGGSGGY